LGKISSKDKYKKILNNALLYCFTPDKFARGRDIIDIVKSQINGGADIIQLREKNLSDREKLSLALKLRKITLDSNTLLIINDDVDIAYFSNADGVHLGQSDIPVEYARKLLKDKIIGISTHNLKQFKIAQTMDVDYIAIGPIFPTQTKENHEPIIGEENLRDILKYKKKKVVGIGGIKYENVEKVIKAGVDCAAVISDIINSYNIEERTRLFKEKIKKIISI